MCRFARRTGGVKTLEDIHQIVEERLQYIPPFSDGTRRNTTWVFGFWSNDLGTVGGEDWYSFFEQLLFVYVGCDRLIESRRVRRHLAKTHTLLFGYYRDLRLLRWWRRE